MIQEAYPNEHDWSRKTFERLMAEYAGDTTENLDSPWSVSQVNDGIMLPGAMKRIIDIQRLLMATGHWLTIRRVKYIVRLSMLTPILSQFYPTDEEQNLVLLQLASFYSFEDQKIERLQRAKERQQAKALQQGKAPQPVITETATVATAPVTPATMTAITAAATSTTTTAKISQPRTVYANTRETLDKTFFIDQQLNFGTILEEWMKLYGIFLRVAFKGKKVDYTQDRDLNMFINRLIKNNTGDAASFINDHPEYQIKALRYMVLSTRKNLIDPLLYNIFDDDGVE
jgi:hypothetical protein